MKKQIYLLLISLIMGGFLSSQTLLESSLLKLPDGTKPINLENPSKGIDQLSYFDPTPAHSYNIPNNNLFFEFGVMFTSVSDNAKLTEVSMLLADYHPGDPDIFINVYEDFYSYPGYLLGSIVVPFGDILYSPDFTTIDLSSLNLTFNLDDSFFITLGVVDGVSPTKEIAIYSDDGGQGVYRSFAYFYDSPDWGWSQFDEIGAEDEELFMIARLTTPCDHSIVLNDSYGDGWDGAMLDVEVNGVVVLDDITVNDPPGDTETYYFSAGTGDDIDIIYTPGDYENEHSYTVYDNDGNILGQSGPNPSSISDLVGYCSGCPSSSKLEVSGQTTTTADLSWNAIPSAAGYNWEVVPSGNGQGVGVFASGNTANTNVTATGLSDNTTYDAYVQNDCGSNFTGPVTFTTLCASNSTYPFTEGFESGTLPDCWSQEYEVGDTDWQYTYGVYNSQYPATPHSGNYNANFYYPSTTSPHLTKLVSPPLDLTSLSAPTLTFWHTQALWSPDQDELRIYFKNSATAPWTLLAEYLDDIPDWTQEFIPLPLASDDYYIAFEGTGKYGYGIGLDDVVVDEGPTYATNCDPIYYTGFIDVPITVYEAPGTQLGADITLASASIIIEYIDIDFSDLSLVSPNGNVVTLVPALYLDGFIYGGPWNCPNEVTTFDMNAAIPINQGIAPFIGSFIPFGDFADFEDGSDPNGTWYLRIQSIDGGSGTVNYAELTFKILSSHELDFYNLQSPQNASIASYQNETIYAQCFEANSTPPDGPGIGIECWIGYSTTDTDPSTWTNWVPATYNYGHDPDNNDEYMAELGLAQDMSPGTYYYASRFRYLEGPYTYGGFNTGAGDGVWDGTDDVSGVLTITPATCEHSIVLNASSGERWWYFAMLDVEVNGVVVLDNITLNYSPGFTETYYFLAQSGDDIDIIYTSGWYDDNNTYIVYDNDGSILGQSGPNPGSIYDLVAFCPNCPSLLNLTASNIGEFTMDLSWNAAGAVGYDWEIVPTGNQPGVDVVASGNTTSTLVTATGLERLTTYDAYVRNDCGSSYTGPVTFTTITLQVPKENVCVEIATGTWAPYCPGAAMGPDDLISNGHDVAIIQNHNNDDYSNVYSDARNSYYNIGGFPTAKFDGVLEYVGGNQTQSLYPEYLLKYNERIAIPSDFTISIEGLTVDFESCEATINIEKLTGSYGTLKLLLTVTESEIVHSWQGMSHLNFVNRLMLPDENGTDLDFGSQSSHQLILPFNIDAGWEYNNCEVVAFLQDDLTKEIYQSVKLKLNDFSQTITPCDHSIVLNDSYGNGWTGTTLDVLVNDIVVLDDISVQDPPGYTETYYFSAYTGDDIDIIYTPGSNENDNTYIVYGSDGTILGQSGPNPVSLYDLVGYCSSCPSVTVLSVDDLTHTTADLSWVAVPDAVGYDWEIVPSGNGQGNGVVVSGNTTDTFLTASGLVAGTDYDAFVQNDCGSTYTGPVTFTTPCYANTTYPFTEGFEGGILPDCWSQEYEVGTTDWEYTYGVFNSQYPYAPHSGIYNANFFHPSSTSPRLTKLVTPPLDLTSLSAPTLTFWHTQAFYSPDQDELRIYFKNSATAPWTLLAEYLDDIPDWTEEIIPLPLASDDYYIAFEGTGNYGYGIGLDDVVVDEGPSFATSCNLGSSIPDDGCATFNYWDVPIPVVGAPGTQLGVDIRLVSASIIIEHTWDSDLEISLVSPNNVVVELSTGNGSGGDNYGDPLDCPASVTTFAMNAATSITSGTAPFIGSFIPEGDFTDFNDGSDPNLDWYLRVCDAVGDDVGTVEYVELVFSLPSTQVLSYYNLQHPENATIEVYQNATVYAQCWEDLVTPPDGPGADIECWIGYSTTDTDPSTWTNWEPATYNYGHDPDNNDEYQAFLGGAQGLAAGTYYYASRFRYLEGPFTYGGYNTGAWDGTNDVSGVLMITPFTNDDCTDAITVNCGDVVSGSTETATNSAIPDCQTYPNTAADVWYHFVGTDQMVSADLCGSGYDTRISVFEGNCNALECIDGNDDYCSFQSRIDWFAESDVDYYIMVHGYNLATGAFDLTIDCTDPATATWVGGDVSYLDGNSYEDWFGADNWDVQDVPGATTDVTVPTGLSYYPTIDRLAVCNDIFIGSDITGTATLVDDGYLTVDGTATVQRYYTANQQWHYISAPVTGVVSGLFTGLYLQSHDETTNAYTYIVDTDVPLTQGKGFALWNQNGSATANFEGPLSFSTSSSLTRTNAGFGSGWNLVGNPYPSSIDWEAPSGWTKTNVAASTYRWDGGVSGNWAVWNGVVGTNGATQFISSGQGFFVSVNDNGSTTGTLGFTSAVRLHEYVAFFKEEPADIVKLKVSGNDFSDETAVYFRDEATIGFDEQMDAHKFSSFNAMAPYIYSTANKGMAINALPEVETVPLNVKVGIETGIYTIETVNNGNFNDLYLEDVFTGTITNLNNNAYTFEYIPGFESRFNLHFSTVSVNSNVESIYIYSYEKDIFVVLPENTKGTVKVYDLTGRKIISKPIYNTKNKITLEECAYYVVQVVSTESVVTKKVFIK